MDCMRARDLNKFATAKADVEHGISEVQELHSSSSQLHPRSTKVQAAQFLRSLKSWR